MAKQKKVKEVPEKKPRGKGKRPSSTRSQRNILELDKQKQEILRQSEEHYRTLVEQSLMGLAVIQDFHIIFANTAFAKIYGYTIDELLSFRPEKVGALIHPEDQALVWGRYRDRLAGKAVPPHYECRGIRKDGTVCWLEMYSNRIEYGGKPAIQAVYIDITERKRAEEARQESEERYRALFDRSLDCVFIHDFEGNFLDANEAALKLLGYEREDIPDLNFASLLSQDQLHNALANLQEFKDTGVQKHMNEYRLRCKDGSFVDVEVIGAVIYHEGKPYAIQGVGRDITERKQAEERLKESEEKYRTILEEMGDGYFEVDLPGNITFVNDEMIRRLGYSKEEIIGMNYRTMRPKEAAKAVFEAYNRIYKTGEPLRNIFTEIICKDGRHIFAETSAFPIRNNKGEIIGFRGIRRDITERKQAEEALKQSEEKYRTILEEMEEGYYEVDLTGTFTFVNDAMSHILGYSRDELIGMNYKIYTPKEDVKPIFKAYNHVYRTGEPLKWFPMPEIRKDGTRILAEDSVFPLWNEKGEVIGFRGISRNVTERKRAEEALRQSEERYRQLAENAGEAILVVQDRVIKFINPKGPELSGYSVDEMVSRPFAEFIYPDDISMVADRYARRLKGESVPQIYDFRIVRKDGDIRWGELNAVPISWEDRPAVLCFMSDITERKRAEEALRQSEERYRAILEKMEDSYFEVDLAGNLTFVNSSACRHLGYSREELIRMSYKDFTDKDYIKAVFLIFNEVYQTATPNKGFLWKIIRKDGSPGFIDTSVAPLQNDKGEIIGFSGVGRDITDRKKIEEQLILTDRMASIGQLAAGIAHELNNPLTAVIGFSDLLIGRELTADVKEDLETINREARRAINIVKGLLAFAREQRTEKLLVNINSIIQGVLQLRSYEQRVSNIEVDARFAPALPEVMGNGAQLQQVFLNIIINAEQVMLEAHRRGKLTIVTERVGDVVRASFTDDGPGISPDNMKQLFTPFFTTREVGKGTGLGLSICHGIVTEHGGKVYAESEPGKGATFVVELPISK